MVLEARSLCRIGTDLLIVSAGVIDGDTGKRIVKNILTEFKGDWYELPAVHGA